MRRAIEWIKRNKLTTFLLVIITFLIFRSTPVIPYQLRQKTVSPDMGYTGTGITLEGAPAASRVIRNPSMYPPVQEFTPTDTADRLVVQETNLSILVNDVRKSVDAALNYVKEQGGYMVSSSITQPEEAPFATLILRVPSDKLRESMEYFRSLAIKVSSEYVQGEDVTDEYQDIDSRLKTLEQTKTRFEEILSQAVKIDDILRVQQEIISLQSQIDSLKGRQLYLEQTAKLARVTMYLSTDEIALPYARSECFGPNVIVKLAYRSLVRNVRKVATAAIWAGVYAVVWVPVLGIVLYLKRRMKKSSKPQ